MLKRWLIALRLRLNLILIGAAGIISALIVATRWRKSATTPPAQTLAEKRAQLETQRQAAVARAAIETHVAAARDEAAQLRLSQALADPDRDAGRRRLIELEQELLGDGGNK